MLSFSALQRGTSLIQNRWQKPASIPHGVIGSTTDSGSVSWGSSPCGVIKGCPVRLAQDSFFFDLFENKEPGRTCSLSEMTFRRIRLPSSITD